jgi:hypothetical protein
MCAPFEHEERRECKHSNCAVQQADFNQMAGKSQGLATDLSVTANKKQYCDNRIYIIHNFAIAYAQ